MRMLFAVGLVLASAWSGLVHATPYANLTDLPGSPVRQIDELHGKVVIIDFWASWCGPCRKSFPWLNQMQQKYQAQGLVILAVNEDEQREDANAFLKQYPAEFAVLFDQQGQVAQQYQLKGMPTTLVLDRQGQLKYSHIGFFESKTAQYEQDLQQLLAEEVQP